MEICEVPGCGEAVDRIAFGHRLCSRHHAGDIHPAPELRMCEIADCVYPAMNQVATRCVSHLGLVGLPLRQVPQPEPPEAA